MEPTINSQEEILQESSSQSLLPNKVEWTEDLCVDIFYEWYKKFSDSKSDLNSFSSFLKGEINRFDFDFEDEISDADLIRIGFYLGFSYDKQNHAFGRYRRNLKRRDRLDSNRCPKGWQRFNNSKCKAVNVLKDLLTRHGQPFIPSYLSKQEQESYKQRISRDMQSEISCLEKELAFRRCALNRLNNRDYSSQ